MSDNEVSAFADTCLINGYLIDKQTGEIVAEGGRYAHQDISYLQPLDISSITSRGVYEEVVKARIKKWYKLWVSPMLLDIVIERGTSIPALSTLCLLGQKIGYNNMVYTSIKELATDSGYSRQTVTGAVVELKQKGFVREVENRLEEKESRFLLINPLYFFLGYYPHRENLLKDWMMGKGNG